MLLLSMVAMLPFIATVQRFLVTILPFMTADLFPWEKRKKEKAAASNVEEFVSVNSVFRCNRFDPGQIRSQIRKIQMRLQN